MMIKLTIILRTQFILNILQTRYFCEALGILCKFTNILHENGANVNVETTYIRAISISERLTRSWFIGISTNLSLSTLSYRTCHRRLLLQNIVGSFPRFGCEAMLTKYVKCPLIIYSLCYSC